MKDPVFLSEKKPPAFVRFRRARRIPTAIAFALAAVIAMEPAAAEETRALAAGQYEGAFTATIGGEQQPPETDYECFTESDLEHLETWWAESLGDGCSVADLKSSPPVTTFEVVCPGDEELVSTRVELTTGTNSFKAVTTITQDIFTEKLEAVQIVDARRVGDCTPENAE